MRQKLAIIITSVLAMMAPFLMPAVVYAQTAASEAICEGVNDGSGATSCTDTTSGTAVSNVIKGAIRIFQAIIGIISVFTILLAGMNYITSGGDAGKTKTARERIMYAVIGLVIVGLAEIIVQFALNRAYGL